MIALTLYSRPECRLCDELLDELVPLIEGRAEVQVIDISDDEALTRRYGLMIPVLKYGDEVLARYRLEPARIAELLDRHAT